MTSPATGRVEPVLEIRRGSIGYGDAPVLEALDFRLDPGEVCAVLGANGSGKSTLVKGLLGLARVTAGDVRLFGQPAAQFRDRARLGYVPQRQAVGGALPVTVGEVVAGGRLARMRRFRPSGRADRQAIAAAIDTVGLAGRERHPVATLSGGQQRRVLIARALAGDPDVLVLDEPMAGVDLASQEALAKTLAALVARGSTVLLVAHELGPVEPLVTRVVHLAHGVVDYDGPPLSALSPLRADGHDPHPHDAAPGRRPGIGLTG